jgi:hypothetical protein
VPGFAFDSAASSGSDFTSSLALTTRAWVMKNSCVIGSKAVTGS